MMEQDAKATSSVDTEEKTDSTIEDGEAQTVCVDESERNVSSAENAGKDLPLSESAEHSQVDGGEMNTPDVKSTVLPEGGDHKAHGELEDDQGGRSSDHHDAEHDQLQSDNADVSPPESFPLDFNMSTSDEAFSEKASSDVPKSQQEELSHASKDVGNIGVSENESSQFASEVGPLFMESSPTEEEDLKKDCEVDSPEYNQSVQATNAATLPQTGRGKRDQDLTTTTTSEFHDLSGKGISDGTVVGGKKGIKFATDFTEGKLQDSTRDSVRNVSSASTVSSTASGKPDGSKRRSRKRNETKSPSVEKQRSTSSGDSRSSELGMGEGRALNTKEEVERDLERMRMRKVAEAEALRKKRAQEKAKLMAKMEKEKKKKGLEILPGAQRSRGVITTVLRQEERVALESEKAKLVAETKRIREEIDDKYAISRKVKGADLLASAAEFLGRKPPNRPLIPERIRRHLTLQEIMDLKLVFDMFDVRGKGYISSSDLKRAAGMLGFKANKTVFKEMIAELAVDQRGRVTLTNFLDFVIRSQGDGPDPLDDIIQGFRLLDGEGKGFLTFADLRASADDLGLPLSNRALREMMEEADSTGSGKLGFEDFVQIMLQTSKFRSVV